MPTAVSWRNDASTITLKAMLLLFALVCAGDIHAAPDDRTTSAVQSDGVSFRTDAGLPLAKLLTALFFVGGLALIAVVAKRYANRHRLANLGLPGERMPEIRLLGMRRLGPRLKIMAIEVGRDKVFLLADNGNHLLKLDQWPVSIPTNAAETQRE